METGIVLVPQLLVILSLLMEIYSTLLGAQNVLYALSAVVLFLENTEDT